MQQWTREAKEEAHVEQVTPEKHEDCEEVLEK
jgi:hypothetical protein